MDIALLAPKSHLFSSFGSTSFSLISSESLSAHVQQFGDYLCEPNREKSAYHRHQRSLARIVVEQWKYVTRSRLLRLKFQNIYKEYPRRLYFAAWKEFLDAKCVKRCHNSKAAMFHQKVAQKRVLLFWRSIMQYKRALKHGLIYFSQLAARWRCKLVLHVLDEHAKLKIWQHTYLRKADHFWRLSLLSRYFSNWQMELKRQNIKQHKIKTSLCKWAEKRIRSTFSYWKAFCFEETCRHSELQKERACDWHNVRLESKALRSLRSILQQRKLLDQSAFLHSHKRFLKRAFSAFQDWLDMRCIKQSNYFSASHSFQINSKKKCWILWKEHLHMLKSLKKAHLLAKLFFVWRAHFQTKKEIKQIQAHQLAKLQKILYKSKLSRIWSHWIIIWRELRSQEVKKAYVVNRSKSYRLRSAMKGWLILAQEKQLHAHVKNKARMLYRTSLQKMVLEALLHFKKKSHEKTITKQSSEKNSTPTAHVGWNRPLPRRPAFILHDSPDLIIPTSSQTQNCTHSAPLTGTANVKHECKKCHLGLTDPEMITNEILWVESILSSYEDLRTEIEQQQADLAVVEQSDLVEQGRKLHQSGQKLAALLQRERIMRPMIQAIAEIMPKLRIKKLLDSCT
ncbi:hypothetical protein O6H91_21G047800 [Diphasiastrum complanatum]|uniref:Uncharacterized protein n=1 Tax=Diphasiastrum complanatum TaxID=34168 RepID=A0ACC2AK58_DIPCM|nr:hypothetical protein O6H91_21G047800 [Diphasiastrum complanatum]